MAGIGDFQAGHSLIYFLRNPKTKLIKIGRSANFSGRYNRLCAECGCDLEFLGLIAEDRWSEYGLHRIFAKLRHVDEWFADSPTLRKFIAKHASKDVPEIDRPLGRVQVPIEPQIAHQAREVARSRGLTIHDYLSEILREEVDRDFRKL